MSTYNIAYVQQEPRSLLRRAWDTIENIFGFTRPSTNTQIALPTPLPQSPALQADTQSTTSLSMSTYAMAYNHIHDTFYTDDATSDDEGRALSRTSQEVIRVPRARNLMRFNTWKQENEGPEWMNDTGSEEQRAKELIANWAMGEVAPWFN